MYGYYGYYGYGPGYGWGRGRGRGFGRGRGWGRGWGYGATLGYCPWTGMPRGWRWMQPYGPYGTGYAPYGNPSPYWVPQQYGTYGRPAPLVQRYYGYPQQSSVDERTALENEARYLEERLKEIDARLKALKGE